MALLDSEHAVFFELGMRSPPLDDLRPLTQLQHLYVETRALLGERMWEQSQDFVGVLPTSLQKLKVRDSTDDVDGRLERQLCC